MTLPVAVAAAMFLGLVAYAVLGGADFGSGFFDLTAGGTASGAELRTQIDHSVGPVWEANHVWLIYVLVMWWTAFPETFAATMSTLILPLLFGLLGIVLRGASFAFRKYSATLAQARLFGAIFAGSSLLAPFFLGAAAGAVASGRVPAGGQGNPWTSWLTTTSMLVGLIAIGSCAFLAGTFLSADADRAGHESLARQLRARTILVGSITGGLVLGALIPIAQDAPTLADGLTGRAAPLIVTSVVGGLLTLVLLLLDKPAPARFTAVIAVASVVLGWGVAQYPWLLVDEVTISEAAGAPATLRALLVVVSLAAVIVLPALAYLLRLTQTESWSRP